MNRKTHEQYTHIGIILTNAEVPARILARLRQFTGDSYAKIKDRIAWREPVILARFLDNAFEDGGFSRLRSILDFLEESGMAFDIYEYELGREENAETSGVHRSKTTAEIVRNEMTASEGDRERMDEIWELRLAEKAKGTSDRQ